MKKNKFRRRKISLFFWSSLAVGGYILLALSQNKIPPPPYGDPDLYPLWPLSLWDWINLFSFITFLIGFFKAASLIQLKEGSKLKKFNDLF